MSEEHVEKPSRTESPSVSAPARSRRGVRSVLRQRDFRLVLASRLASELGTWLAFVALTLHVFALTGSAVWVSALLLANFVPSIAAGFLLAPLIDRLPRRGLLIGSDVVNAAVFTAVVFVDSAPLLVLFAGLSGLANTVFRPALLAGLPNLVTEEDLPAANTALQTSESAANLAGPLLGGVIVAATGVELAYVFNAVSFLASAGFLTPVAAGRFQGTRSASRGHWRDIAEGLAVVRRTPTLWTIVVTWSLGSLAFAGINVAEVVLAKVDLDGGDFGYGLLVASAGLGLTVGSAGASTASERLGASVAYRAGFVAMAAGFGAAAAAPNVWLAAGGVLVGGAGNGVSLVCLSLLIQRTADELRGRVYAIMGSSVQAALGIGMLAAGPLTELTGARLVWAGAAVLLASLALASRAMRAGAPASLPGPGLPSRR